MMRMWMCDPSVMCRAHLLGEHRELHALIGIMRAGTNLQGYVDNKLIELHNLEERHAELVREMLARGYNHNSPIKTKDHQFIERWLLKNWVHLAGNKKAFGVVNHAESFTELLRRCPACFARANLQKDAK